MQMQTVFLANDCTRCSNGHRCSEKGDCKRWLAGPGGPWTPYQDFYKEGHVCVYKDPVAPVQVSQEKRHA